MTSTASVDSRIQLISTGKAPGSTCSDDLASGPWDFDSGPAGYGPGASMNDPLPASAPRQGELPAEYREADVAELHERIRAAKRSEEHTSELQSRGPTRMPSSA